MAARAETWADPLPPFEALVRGLVEDQDLGPGVGDIMPATSIRASLPIEIAVRSVDGRLHVEGSTPTQWTETTVMPVFHRLTVHIARTGDGEG